MTNEKCAENVQLKELQNLYSRPLTAQESDFAAQHLSLVRGFCTNRVWMNRSGLMW